MSSKPNVIGPKLELRCGMCYNEDADASETMLPMPGTEHGGENDDGKWTELAYRCPQCAHEIVVIVWKPEVQK